MRLAPAQPVDASATTPPSLARTLGGEFPDGLVPTRVVPAIGCEQHRVSSGPWFVNVRDACLVDGNFFGLFDFHFTAGNAADALSRPHSVVLLKPVADKLFGKDNPIGKEIWVQNAYGNNKFLINVCHCRGGRNRHRDGRRQLPGCKGGRRQSGGKPKGSVA